MNENTELFEVAHNLCSTGALNYLYCVPYFVTVCHYKQKYIEILDDLLQQCRVDEQGP